MTLSAFLQEPSTADTAEAVWRAYEPAKAEAKAKETRRVTVTFGQSAQSMSVGETIELKMALRKQLDKFFRQAAIARLEEIAEVERTQVYGGRGSAAIVAPRWRKHRERTAMARLLAHKNNSLDKRQARRDALVELVTPADIEANETQPPPIDHVTPLGERGPPAVREISSDRGHGLSAALGKVPAMAGSQIVPTGRSGGER